MATFRFYQDKEVKTWVRDYYNVEAETLDDAIKQIQEAKESLDDLEYDSDNVEFDYRDDSVILGACHEDLPNERVQEILSELNPDTRITFVDCHM